MSLRSSELPASSNISLDPGSSSSVQRGLPWAIAACLAVALAARLSFLGEPFRNDAGIFTYLGKVLWTGGKLYVDVWDTKLPTVPLLMAPLYGVFGSHWFAYVLLQATLGITAAWALAVALRRYVGPDAFSPALLWGLVGLNLSRLTITGFQLETIQIFFESLSACMVLRTLAGKGSLASTLAAGVFAGLAMFAKPTGLAVAGAASCALLWQIPKVGVARTGARLAALAVGVLIPVAAVIGWVQNSSFRDQIPDLFREISLYGSGTPLRSLLQFKTWIFFVLPFTPMALRFIIVRLSSDRSPTAEPAADSLTAPNFSVTVFAVAWALIAIAAVFVQRRLYGYHFLILMPPAVVLFAIIPRSTRLWPTLVAIAPLALLSLFFTRTGYTALAAGRGGISPVSRYVIEHTAPTDTVWADPAARLLVETHRETGTRWLMTFYFVNHDDAPRLFGDGMLNDFEQKNVKYVVLSIAWRKETLEIARTTPGTMWRPQRYDAYLAAIEKIDRYVKEKFQLEATIDGKLIYRRMRGPEQ